MAAATNSPVGTIPGNGCSMPVPKRVPVGSDSAEHPRTSPGGWKSPWGRWQGRDGQSIAALPLWEVTKAPEPGCQCQNRLAAAGAGGTFFLIEGSFQLPLP